MPLSPHRAGGEGEQISLRVQIFSWASEVGCALEHTCTEGNCAGTVHVGELGSTSLEERNRLERSL